jgi:O-6-methylguanine DNA methyltransferase
LFAQGTEFRKRVWSELLNIPFGSTRTYIEQASGMMKSESVRAVAGANGMNPVCILIPCHRVIGSNGSLTGYSGGLHRKKWLLDHEKRFSGQPVNGSLFS